MTIKLYASISPPSPSTLLFSYVIFHRHGQRAPTKNIYEASHTTPHHAPHRPLAEAETWEVSSVERIQRSHDHHHAARVCTTAPNLRSCLPSILALSRDNSHLPPTTINRACWHPPLSWTLCRSCTQCAATRSESYRATWWVSTHEV